MIGSMIGREVAVTASGNPTLVGRSGTVIDESKNTLTLKTSNGVHMIIKQSVVVQCADTTLDGRTIVGTAAERLKRC